jgi:tetratricopeptide (TPR) repeat protein
VTLPAILLALAAGAATAEGPCDAPCERVRAERLLRSNDLREAIEHLRNAVGRYPDDSALPLLLARAYMLEGNLFWAESTLRTALDRRPDDAETRSWLALVHLREGDPELAKTVLATGPPPRKGPGRSRRALLGAYLADVEGDAPEGLSLLSGIGRSTPVYPEDRRAFSALGLRLDPWRIEPLSGELELAAGATSNALAGAPTDPGGQGTGSGLADGTIRLRFAPGLTSSIRAVFELDGEGHFLADEEYRELSSLLLGGRVGGLATLGRYRALAAWRAEVLHLDQSPSLYSEAHRGEVEVETTAGGLFFGGAGHRVYRDERRTRNEWDLGLGGPIRAVKGAPAVFGATVRGASARSEAYDLLGASLALAVRFSLPGGVTARLSGSGSWDDYPHSGGAEGLLVFGTRERRQDLTGKATLGLWLQAWRRLRVGLEGQLSRRDSTADERPGFDFDYTEASARLLVRVGFGTDPSAPAAVSEPGHVPLEWGLGPGEASEAERIIDLLRQDEELRRGSSCGIR